MRRGKKILLTAILSVVVLGGTLGRVAMASDGEDESNPITRLGNFIEKVIGIYEEKTGTTIDKQALEDSFEEAGDQLRTEKRDELHQRLIEEGLITQEQLDELEKWLEARPDFPTEEFEEWMESRPDLPDTFRFGHRGDGKFFGFGDREEGKFFFDMQRGHRGPGGGFHGWCLPGDSTE